MINQVSHSSQLGSGIVFLVFASVAVALRFYSKTLTKSKLAADDWWISLSLLCLYAWIGVQYWGRPVRKCGRFLRYRTDIAYQGCIPKLIKNIFKWCSHFRVQYRTCRGTNLGVARPHIRSCLYSGWPLQLRNWAYSACTTAFLELSSDFTRSAESYRSYAWFGGSSSLWLPWFHVDPWRSSGNRTRQAHATISTNSPWGSLWLILPWICRFCFYQFHQFSIWRCPRGKNWCCVPSSLSADCKTLPIPALRASWFVQCDRDQYCALEAHICSSRSELWVYSPTCIGKGLLTDKWSRTRSSGAMCCLVQCPHRHGYCVCMSSDLSARRQGHQLTNIIGD